MFKKLRYKFLLLNITMISMLMIVSFISIYMITYNNIQIENQNKLESMSMIKQPAINTDAYILNGKINLIIHELELPEFLSSFNILIDENNNIVNIRPFVDMPYESCNKLVQLALNKKQDFSIVTLENRKWQYVFKYIPSNIITNENVYSVKQITFLDVTDSINTLLQLLITFIIIGILMLIVIFIISVYFANRAIKPIKDAWDKQKQFIADASHELKTPLAIINANSDALLANQEETIINQKKWLDYIKIQTDRMSKLISDLLFLAKTEDINIKTIHLPFDISVAINDVILSMEVVIFEKGINFKSTLEPDIMIKGDEEKIKQLTLILLDNAIKYTNSNGLIDITLKKSKRKVIFSIKNSGKGIEKSHLEKIFDRFYRVDSSRSREDGGYGLGLSIAKAIIDNHNGKLNVESIEGETTTFNFILNIY